MFNKDNPLKANMQTAPDTNHDHKDQHSDTSTTGNRQPRTLESVIQRESVMKVINSRDDNANNNHILEHTHKHNKTPKDVLGYKQVRRKHTNSRHGCSACKKRRIKCDERLPKCSYCEKRGIHCSYLTMTPFQIHRLMEAHLNSKRVQSLLESNDDLSKSISLSGSSSTSGSGSTPITEETSPHYLATKEINLNDGSFYTDNSMYKVYAMEELLLPSSMGNRIFHNMSSEDTTSFATTKSISKSFRNDQTSSSVMMSNAKGTLLGLTPIPIAANARQSTRLFDINRSTTILSLEKFVDRSLLISKATRTRDFKTIMKLLVCKTIDASLQADYFQIISTAQIYDTLLRKSFLLFALDYYKNTLVMQHMFPLVNYKVKLSITGECQRESDIFIDEITKIIKNEYLPTFQNFSSGAVNYFTGSLVILDICLAYHFKKGLKYELSTDESNKAVNLVGIFSTGMYAVVMERSKQELLMSGTNILSAHIITRFKKLLIKGYPLEIFHEFRKSVDKLSNKYVDHVDYENLKIFCDKQLNLMSIHIQKESLLGFNSGYIIKLLNSLQAIVPFDICNLDPNNEKLFIGKDLDIIVYFCFYTLGYLLEAILPGVENVASNGFVGPGWKLLAIGDIESMIKMLKLLKSNESKLLGIYLLRTASFFRNRGLYYQKYLSNFTLDTLLDEDSDLSIDQKVSRLKTLKANDIMNEVYVRTFSIEKGQFFQSWNYPNSFGAKPKKGVKLVDFKITNCFPNENDLIADFINNNNGFFSMDYDCSADLAGGGSVANETSFIDGFEMKMLWKLTTYIRINNM